MCKSEFCSLCKATLEQEYIFDHTSQRDFSKKKCPTKRSVLLRAFDRSKTSQIHSRLMDRESSCNVEIHITSLKFYIGILTHHSNEKFELPEIYSSRRAFWISKLCIGSERLNLDKKWPISLERDRKSASRESKILLINKLHPWIGEINEPSFLHTE